MENGWILQLKDLGYMAAFGLSGLGSCLGVAAAGQAAVGAWKKCFMQNKVAPFILAVFIGAPLSQTIYGMILMNDIIAAMGKIGNLWMVGVFGGMVIGMSAWIQGKIGAAASDAMAETGKGFGNYLVALGIIETVALFIMGFLKVAIGGMLKAVGV
jgi:V/A-type H+-transporting ATPase subunit K